MSEGGWNFDGFSAVYTVVSGFVGSAATAAVLIWRRGFTEGGQAATTNRRFAEMDAHIVDIRKDMDGIRSERAGHATTADVFRVEADLKRMEEKMDEMSRRIDRFIDRGARNWSQ